MTAANWALFFLRISVMQTENLMAVRHHPYVKTNQLSLHQHGVGLFLVDLVTDVVDVRGEVVLGVVVDDVTDIREGHILKYAIFQVF